jgi:hypothetical protein
MGKNTAEIIDNKHENIIDTRYFRIIKQLLINLKFSDWIDIVFSVLFL